MTPARPAAINPTSPAQLRALFTRLGFRPRRSLGQTFLVDDNIVHKIVAAAQLGSHPPVVEIGAGAGAVTRALSEVASTVLAVEIDPTLAALLRDTLGHTVEVVEADLLALDWSDIFPRAQAGRWRLVANLPYAITGPAILKLLEATHWVDRFVIMVQAEVAERLIAPPGGRSRGLLSVLVQAACTTALSWRVSRTCFWPRPQVDSVLLTLDVRRPPLVAPALEGALHQLARAAFSVRRKTLLNALAHASDLELAKTSAADLLSEARIEPDRRAETLSVEDFVRLAQAFLRRRGETPT
jgi:16S rRNA (adenine1518-N6/adenine1519-N6)-dimethyltransferase